MSISQLLLDKAGIAYWEMDSSTGNVTFGATKISDLGYNANLFKTYHDFLALVHPDDFQYIMAEMRKLISGEICKYSVEFRMRNNKGEYHWFKDTAVIKSESDYGVIIEGVTVSIQINRMYDKEISRLNSNFEAIFNSNIILATISDIETGQIDEVSDGFLRIMGFKKDEILKRTSTDIGYISFRDREFIKKSIQRNGTVKDLFLTLKRKNGSEINVLYNGKVIVRNDVNKILSIATDITDMVNYEKELIVAKEAAESADKLKSEFLAQISHEIRTPIGSIVSFSQILMEYFTNPIDKDLEEIILGIESAGKRIIRTIDLILNVSILNSGKYEVQKNKFKLGEDIINKLYKEFKFSANLKNLNFEMKCEADRSIFIDEYSVTQIFSNLIDNAIKYTNSGYVLIKSYENEGKFFVVIEDSGIGISKENQGKIFDIFRQEETGYIRRFDGTGLGLYLVKKYSEINGIKLKLESEKGKGTKFFVIFESFE